MQKTAQTMGLMNKIREFTNISGRAAESVFDDSSGSFKKLMDDIRNTDDSIRSIITGKVIGRAMPPNNISAKDILKNAKSNFNKREYMTAVRDLGQFHKRMNDIVDLSKKLTANLDDIHNQFLFEGVDPEVLDYLGKDLGGRFTKKKANQQSSIEKNAGILDFLSNIFTERGRALKALEKRFPNRFKTLKNKTSTLITSSENLLSVTLSSLKKMALARAHREPDDYFESIGKIIEKYMDYDKVFADYYETQVRGFLEKVLESKKEPQEIAKQLGEPENEEIIEVTDSDIVSTKPVISPQESEMINNLKLEVETLRRQLQDTANKGKEDYLKQLIRDKMQQIQEIAKPSSGQFLSYSPTFTFDKGAPSVSAPAAAIPAAVVPAAAAPAAAPTAPTAPAPAAAPMTIEQLDKIKNKLLGEIGQLNLLIKTSPPAQQTEIQENINNKRKQLTEAISKIKEMKKNPKTSSKFLLSLEKMSNESPDVLSKYIYKYAKLIDKTDPETANKLLNVLKSIKG